MPGADEREQESNDTHAHTTSTKGRQPPARFCQEQGHVGEAREPLQTLAQTPHQFAVGLV